MSRPPASSWEIFWRQGDSLGERGVKFSTWNYRSEIQYLHAILFLFYKVSRLKPWFQWRTFLAIILLLAKGGVFVLEQPHSSLVFRHPRFQKLLRLTTVSWLKWSKLKFYKCKGCLVELYSIIELQHVWSPTEIFKQSFWMRGWGGTTPKRTTLWSNSRGVRFFSTNAKHCRRNKKVKLADSYKDSKGRKRYKGNSNMKSSQSIA